MGADHAMFPAGLSADAQDHLQAASLVLRRYGLNLAAALDQESGRDVLMVRTIPREDLEYKQVLADMGPGEAFGPRLKTSYYRGEVRVVVFECNPPRPVLEIQARPGEGINLTLLDASVPVRLTMEGAAYDLTAEAARA